MLLCFSQTEFFHQELFDMFYKMVLDMLEAGERSFWHK